MPPQSGAACCLTTERCTHQLICHRTSSQFADWQDRPRSLYRSNHGLEREFRSFKSLDGGACITCAPRDQRKSSDTELEQAELYALRCQRPAGVSGDVIAALQPRAVDARVVHDDHDHELRPSPPICRTPCPCGIVKSPFLRAAKRQGRGLDRTTGGEHRSPQPWRLQRGAASRVRSEGVWGVYPGTCPPAGSDAAAKPGRALRQRQLIRWGGSSQTRRSVRGRAAIAEPGADRVLSWQSLDELPGASGATWLDKQLVARLPEMIGSTGLGSEFEGALRLRRQWLLEQGLARAERTDGLCAQSAANAGAAGTSRRQRAHDATGLDYAET